ncbi:MAG: STAS domain-containing protein [Candidatus Eisenbacteria sp.]|nr:STAS domain-containing protein [Candidatus Eisenbacteria bacterium]
MMDLISLLHEDSILLWGRVAGCCGKQECSQLIQLLESVELPPGSHVVLDFSWTDHIDYRAVPLLICLGQRIEGRLSSFRIAGVSDYLRRIVEIGAALDGREFMDRYVDAGLAPSTVVDVEARGFCRGDSNDPVLQGLVEPSLN